MRRDAPTVADPTGASAAEPSHAPDAPVRFAGLRVERRLGAGGSGIVYRAWCETRRAHVALKVLRAGRWASEAQRERFRREVEVHRRLDDPGVVLIFEDGSTPDGAPWLTMELIDGPSLQQLLDSGRLPPLATRVRWIREVARTLARLHARGVFHRDVKPSNILLLGGNEPRLADFGVVLVEDEGRLTVGARGVGTPRFMAPEQLLNEVDDWGRVDVYALGLVLAELVGARRETGEGAPPDLAYILQRASAHAPADRYGSAAALADDLDRWLAGGAVRFRPRALAWRVRRRMPPRTPLWIGLGAALGIAVGLAGIALGERRAAARADADWAAARERVLGMWDAGDADGAEAWVSRFAADPARAGTPAAGRAWLDLAALRRDAGQRDAEVEALGHAVAATADTGVRTAAVGQLVEAYRSAGRWEALGRLLDALPAGELDLDPTLRRDVALDLALARGDVEAARRLRPDLAAVLAPFARVRALPTGTVGFVDTDGDGLVEWVVGGDEPRDPAREGPDWRFGSAEDAFLDARGGLLSAREGAWALDRTGATRVGPFAAHVARVGGRVYAAERASPRFLAEYTASGPVSAHVATNALSAYVEGLVAADVDGDGADELVAGFGPAFGFLLRVFRPGGPGEEPLVPLAEARPGYVSGVAVLPTADGARVIGVLSQENPSAFLFGAADPFGEACGVRAWRYEEGRLVDDGAWPFPPGPCPPDGAMVADLDGDGAAELLVNAMAGEEPALLVLRHHRGAFARLFQLPGYEVDFVASTEGGADRVVLATTFGPGRERSRRWALGEGADALPRRAFEAARADAGGDPTVRLFEALSLDAAAAELSEQRNDHARAAAFWERADEPARAAHALAEAAREDADVALLERAVARAVDAADAGLAAELLARLEARAPGDAGPSRAHFEAQAVPGWHLDLSRPLPTALQVRFPAALRHDLATGELRLRVPAGAGVVLRLPLRATGEPAWLRAAGDWIRAEWGSVVQVRLQRRGTNDFLSPVFLFFRGTGAGGVLFRGAELTGLPRARVARTDVESPFDLRVTRSADGGVIRTVGSFEDEAVRYAAPIPADPPVAGERWELVVTGPVGWGAAPGPLAELVLRRLELGGFEVEAEASPPLAPPLAWAAAAGPPPGVEPAEDPRFVALLRLDPSLLERVHATWGAAAADRLFAATWSTPARVHRGDAGTVDALLAAPSLEGVPAVERLALRVAKGEAFVRTGRVEEARAALRACWAEADAIGVPAWREGLDAAALLAELALLVGDEASAEVWAERAAAAAPDPDLGERLLRSRSRLAATGP